MRLDYKAHAPEFAQAMGRLGAAAGHGPLDRRLRELVRVQTSLLNRCAYCVDMHTKDARNLGETEQRLYALAVWRDVPYFTDRERAAFDLCEAVTVLTRAGVPDAVWANAVDQFDEAELAHLLATIVTSNAWNRIGIAARCWTPGTYEP
jgi:AhpD family alkylhydroperoxidase